MTADNLAPMCRSSSAALLTAVGRGAVATILVQWDSSLQGAFDSLFHAANGRPMKEQRIGQIVFGRWGLATTACEDVVLCRVTPGSLEIHCHGGDAAVRRILDDLQQSGCPTMSWSSQCEREVGAFDAECAEMLSRATTWRTAEILHEQTSGVLRNSFDILQHAVRTGTITTAIQITEELLDWAQFGRHLSQPWTVVLTGRPNVGKSSLINALLGYDRAIVFDQPGTTRDVVTAETAFEGWPVLLADTAGLRDSTEELEAAGIARARERLKVADARLVLVDISQPPTAEDRALVAAWSDAVIIGHKCDLGDCWMSELPANALRASSVTGEGLPQIQRKLVDRLVPRVPLPGTAIPITDRQVELLNLVRDKVLAQDLEAAERAIHQILGVTQQ